MKTKSINQWCEIFKIKLIDNDGFRGVNLDIPVHLEFFLNGITICTINTESPERYKVLDELIRLV